MNHPTSANAVGYPVFDVAGRLNLEGHAEFLGVKLHTDRPPTSALRVMGVDIEFSDPAEADRFAHVAKVMADQLHLAYERGIAREPITADTAPRSDT
ncbi:hypothetical protein [Nonomuraea typhae]|uniref:hypothetical protein n=1 Tax=Nonomuraea typhae TaxID=2603600 RepID=UPI0012FB3669|nr:hypothetical protein [Nonomuraea typhae]